MSWTAITIATLYEAKVAALVNACDSAALGDGQANRSAGIIQGVVNEIRNAVATCPRNQVDSDTTKIPESQRDLAVDLINARLKAALEIALTDDEKTTITWRRQQLRDIAKCDLVVDQPDTSVAPDVQSGGGVTLLGSSDDAHPYDDLGTT